MVKKTHVEEEVQKGNDEAQDLAKKAYAEDLKRGEEAKNLKVIEKVDSQNKAMVLFSENEVLQNSER